jgi:hypothetical protein
MPRNHSDHDTGIRHASADDSTSEDAFIDLRIGKTRLRGPRPGLLMSGAVGGVLLWLYQWLTSR